MPAVLIVEDEARIAAFLEKGLNANGMSTVVVSDGFEALSVAGREPFDLVLLDLGLPTMDGTAVLRELRRRDTQLPVIVLTARDDPADVVAGLDAGANDYVSKPFSFEELLARVRVQLRADRAAEHTTLEHAGLVLDLRTRRAHVAGRTVELTAREFALAEAFLRHPDQVLSRDQLLTLVWGYDHDRAPTSSTSTCATCDASSAPIASSRSAAWATGSTRRPPARSVARRAWTRPNGRFGASPGAEHIRHPSSEPTVSLTAAIPSAFQPCPPLDAPLRLAFELGFFGAPRVRGTPRADCCSDHFASLTPDGSSGLHQIHEAVDLVSGEGSCVFAVYAGTIVDKGPGKLVIDHQGSGEAYASQYLHIEPGPKAVRDHVVKGEPIACVQAHDAGDHLHFELWHWVTADPAGNPDSEAVPVDPTRLLSHWERAHGLDYATLGTIAAAVSGDLDAATASPAVAAAYATAGIRPPPSPTVTVLASGCAWRLTGGDVHQLLRLERGAITVFDEAYGTRTITPQALDRVATVRRWSYSTFLVEADRVTYGVPLHQAGEHDRLVVDLIRHAFEHRHPLALEIRRSPFWRMDGTIDEVSAMVTGVRVG